MKWTTRVMVLCAGLCASAASASSILTHTFDISGLSSEADFVTNFPTLTHNFGVSGTVVEVSFNINATFTAPSWSRELRIAIDTPDDNGLDGDIDMNLFGGVTDSNPFAAVGSVSANSFSSNGNVFLTLYESFNDPPNPDAVYGAGSSVTVDFEVVPEPSTAALFGLGAFGLFLRRRR